MPNRQGSARENSALDEPSSSLDPAHAHAAMRAAKDLCKRGAAVISILHDPNLAAAYATKIALLKDAKLVSFDIPEISLDETLLSKTYSAPCKTLDFDGKKSFTSPNIKNSGTAFPRKRNPQRRRS